MRIVGVEPSAPAEPPRRSTGESPKGSGKKALKRLKKARGLLAESRSNQAGKGAKGHVKKVKAKALLAAELQRLDGSLTRLRDRVSDLHGLQLDQEETQAAIGRRLDELARRAPPDPQSERIDLAGRIARLESAQAALARGPGPAEWAGVQDRLAETARALDAQSERMGLVESRLAQTLRAPATPEDAPWNQALAGLRQDLDGRLAGLADGLAEQGEQAKRRWEVDRQRTDDRLGRLGRRLSRALAALALLAVAAMGALWWHTHSELGLAQSRLASLESRPGAVPGQPAASSQVETALGRISAELDRIASRTDNQAASDDLLARMRRMEAGLAEGSRDLAAGRVQGDALAGRLDGLAADQRRLVERMDRLQQTLAETHEGLATLVARSDAKTEPSVAVAPTPTAAASPSTGPGLAEDSYGVQLVVYGSLGRVPPFVEAHGLKGRASTLQVLSKGRQVYAVLIGPFRTRDQAAQSIGELPPDLRALGPWVRALPAGTRLDPVP